MPNYFAKFGLLVITVLFPLLLHAQTGEECYKYGREYYDMKDYANALNWYQRAANQGDSRAQYMIGLMYRNGYGLTKDFTKAKEWFLKAANQGHIEALFALGCTYNDEKDYANAQIWYQKAADKGHSSALTNLAALYAQGHGVPQDYNKAVELYQKAADKGNKYAQNNLASIYFFGTGGITKNYAKAFELFQRAANQGHANGQASLGYMYANGLHVAKDNAKAVEWYQKAANQGHAQAKKNLAALQKKMAEENYTLAQTTNTPKHVEQTKPLVQVESKEEPRVRPQPKAGIDGVDTDIPVIGRVNNNTFALIFANENYTRETKVDYARNDGEVFRDYCRKTLGLPEKNVHFIPDATLNDLIGELDWLQQVCEAYNGEASVIFYYAGHGIPDEATGSSYLLPIDGNSRILRTCFSINELYKTLGSMPAKKVTVLMDACFSGAQRNGGMLASARGVAIKAKPNAPKGSMIVLSAAQGDETAYKYEDAKHGLFTYFLLKKLKSSKGSVTMGELSDYIQSEVKRYSIVENGKSQTPSVITSDKFSSNWKSQTFY